MIVYINFNAVFDTTLDAWILFLFTFFYKELIAGTDFMFNLKNFFNFIIDAKFNQYYDINMEVVYFWIVGIFAELCDDVDHSKWDVTGIIDREWLMVKQVAVCGS